MVKIPEPKKYETLSLKEALPCLSLIKTIHLIQQRVVLINHMDPDDIYPAWFSHRNENGQYFNDCSFFGLGFPFDSPFLCIAIPLHVLADIPPPLINYQNFIPKAFYKPEKYPEMINSLTSYLNDTLIPKI
jgi:hypothetical protein